MEKYLDTMLISPNRVKADGNVNINVDDAALGKGIRTAQNVYLVDVIGKELVEKLQRLVYNKIKELPDSIDDAENIAYKTLLDEHISNVLSIKASIEVAMKHSLKIRNMGVVQNSDTNVLASNIDDIKYLQNYLETEYNHYLNRMAEFLCENKAAIPESKFDCGCKPKRKYANVNLWLG